MSEKFLLHFDGGHQPGRYIWNGDWPPPEVIAADPGEYHRISFSSLPPMTGPEHVMRSARYEWRPDEL